MPEAVAGASPAAQDQRGRRCPVGHPQGAVDELRDEADEPEEDESSHPTGLPDSKLCKPD